MQVDVLNIEGKKTGRTIELPEEIFGAQPGRAAQLRLHEVEAPAGVDGAADALLVGVRVLAFRGAVAEADDVALGLERELEVAALLHEGGELKLSLSESRLKTKHLRKRPQASLLVLDFSNPMRYLEVHGNVRIDPDDALAFAGRVGAKYDADLSQYDQPGEKRVVSASTRAGEAPQVSSTCSGSTSRP